MGQGSWLSFGLLVFAVVVLVWLVLRARRPR